MTEIPAGDELMELAFAALERGIASVTEGGQLIPFALIEKADGRALARFVAETSEQGQARARDHVRSAGDARRAAIAYGGHLTVEGERSDAIFAEVGGYGATDDDAARRPVRPDGPFVFVSEAPSLGAGAPAARTIARHGRRALALPRARGDPEPARR